ncbi:transposase family protein [Streptomyces sp. NPDC058572]|uniref:transposase family protein n=1 Tax=Streptomyces sp. NPDC058572 TaxID=3346546 RepID=UPI00365E6CF5
MHIVARTIDGTASCQGCGLPSNHVHSCYERRLADTPVGDRPVLLDLTVRRLYCEHRAPEPLGPRGGRPSKGTQWPRGRGQAGQPAVVARTAIA